MNSRLALGLAAVATAGLAVPMRAIDPTPEELRLCTSWLEQHWGPNSSAWPCSFVLGDKPSSELLRAWRLERTTQTTNSNRTEHTLTLTDPASGLSVRCEMVQFTHHPALEWVLHFANNGAQDTTILSAIQGLDTTLASHTTYSPVLHYARGALCSFDDFQPLTETFTPGARVHVRPAADAPPATFCPFSTSPRPMAGSLPASVGQVSGPQSSAR